MLWLWLVLCAVLLLCVGPLSWRRRSIIEWVWISLKSAFFLSFSCSSVFGEISFEYDVRRVSQHEWKEKRFSRTYFSTKVNVKGEKSERRKNIKKISCNFSSSSSRRVRERDKIFLSLFMLPWTLSNVWKVLPVVCWVKAKEKKLLLLSCRRICHILKHLEEISRILRVFGSEMC